MNRVLFPTMARMKDDRVRLKTSYVESLRMIAIVAVPLCMGISGLSPIFVKEILGPEWQPAVIPLSILSLQGLINALITPASNVLISIGKPRYMSVQTTIQAAAIVVGTYPIAVYYGLNGVCIWTTLLTLAALIYFTLVFRAVFSARLVEMVGPLLPPLTSGLAMIVLLTLLVWTLPSDIWTLASLVVVGGAVYILLLYVLSRGRDVRDLIGVVKRGVSSGKQYEP